MVKKRLTTEAARMILAQCSLPLDAPVMLSERAKTDLAAALTGCGFQKRGCGKYSDENLKGFYAYLLRLAKGPKPLTPGEAKRREERRSTRYH